MDVRLPDGRIITNVPDGITQSELVARLQKNGLPPPEGYKPPERTTGEAFKDLAASAVVGAGGIAALPGQIYGAVTGDVDNVSTQLGETVRNYGESLKSEELKFKQAQLRAQAAEAAKNGVLDEFLTTLKGSATDPALLTALLAEFAPNLIPAAGIARGAGALAKGANLARGLTQEAAEKAAVRAGSAAAVGTGAVMEGGGSFEDTYREALDLLAKQGVTGPQAEEIALSQARKAGATTTLATGAVGAIPAFRGLENILAGGGAKGALRTGAGEFAQGVAEGATTTVPGNVALQSIDPNIETFRGTGSAAAAEALGGGVAGGAFGAFGQDVRTPKEAVADQTQSSVDQRREANRLEREQKAADAARKEQEKSAAEGEKLLREQEKAQLAEQKARQKELAAIAAEQDEAARQTRYEQLVDAYGTDFSGVDNYAALVQERAALESLPKTKETKAILANLNARIKELGEQDLDQAKRGLSATQAEERKAQESAFGGAAPAQGELFPMDRAALDNEPPAAPVEEPSVAQKPRVLTRNDLLATGLGQGATIAKGVNPLVAKQAKEAGVRAAQPSENSLVGLDLSKPEDVREAQRILDRIDLNPLIADGTKAALRKLVAAQPELNQRRLNFEGESTEGILASQKNYNEAMREKQVGPAAGTGATDGITPEPIRKPAKVTGAKFFADLRAQETQFNPETGVPADAKVTLADIAAALDPDLKDNAGRANQWFSEANRKKLEETFVGKTPTEIKAMTVAGKPGSLMNAVYTELTNRLPVEQAPTPVTGESNAQEPTGTSTVVDTAPTSEREVPDAGPDATDVQPDSGRSGTPGPVAEQPTGASVGAGVRDTGRPDGGEKVSSGALKKEKPASAKKEKPDAVQEPSPTEVPARNEPKAGEQVGEKVPSKEKTSRVSKKTKEGLPVTEETKALSAEIKQEKELKKISRAVAKKKAEEAPAAEEDFKPLPKGEEINIRPQDFKLQEDGSYRFESFRGDVYEYMPAYGAKGFVVRGPGLPQELVRNQAIARKRVQDTLNGVQEDVVAEGQYAVGAGGRRSLTPPPVEVVKDKKTKAEIERRLAKEQKAREAAEKAKPKKEVKVDVAAEAEFEADKEILMGKAQRLSNQDEITSKEVLALTKEADEKGLLIPEEAKAVRRLALTDKVPEIALRDLMKYVSKGKFDPDGLLFRAGDGAGMDPGFVQDMVDIAKAENAAAPNFVVVRNQTDIPTDIMNRNAEKVANSKGFLDTRTGTVYIIPENASGEKDLIRTITHEMVGHFGLRAVLGDAYSETMRLAARNSAVKKQLGTRKPSELNVEETLAELSELAVDKKLPAPAKGLMARIVKAINAFLRRNGVRVGLTNNEVYTLLADANAYVKTGKGRGEGKAPEVPNRAAFREGEGVTQEDIDRMEEATGGVRAVRREESSVLADVQAGAKAVINAPMDAGAKFRVAFLDKAATVADKVSRLYGTKLQDSLGKINPMGLWRQAEAVPRIMESVFKKGGITLDKDKNLFVATEVTVKNPTSSLEPNTPASVSKLFEIIKDFAQARGLDLDTAEGYLHRALEGRRLGWMVDKNAETEALAAKMKSTEAQKFLDDNLLVLPTNVDLDAFIAESEAAFEKEDFLRQYDDVMRAVREHAIDRAVEAGILSEEQGGDWKEAIEYVPFTRLDEESKQKTVNMVARGMTAFSKIGKLVGSETKPIGNITDNFANNIGWLTSQTMRNSAATQVLQELEGFDYAREMKGAKDFTDQNAVVRVLREGKEVFYEMADPMDANAFASLPLVAGPVTRVLQASTRMLRATVTLMPQFAISQVIQDSFRAGFNSGVQKPFAAMGKTLANFPIVLLVESLGVNHPMVRNFKYMQAKAAKIQGLKDVGTVGQYDLNVLNPAENIRFASGVARRTGWQKFLKAADAFTSASDMAARLAVFEQIQKEFPNDAVRPEVAARELINFNRRGNSDLVGLLINMVPFFNAYLQSMDLMYRNIKGVDTTSGLSKAQMRGQMLKTGGMLTAMSVVYALTMSDNEEYINTPDEIKARYLILPGGIAIPIPPELGAIFKVLPERMVQYIKQSGTPEEQGAMEAIGSAFKTMGQAYLTPNPTPQLVKPLLESWTNYSFFTGRPIVPQSLQDLEPWRQFGSSTSEFALLVGKTFNVSPLMVDQMVSSTFGLAGTTATQLVDAALSDKGDRPLYRTPFISTFVKNPQGGQKINEFYDLREESDRVKKTFNNLVKDDPDAATSYLEKGKNSMLLAINPVITDRLDLLSDLRDYKKYVESTKDMSGEEKRRELDAIDSYRLEVVQDIRELKKIVREGGAL